jgi:hypothetical protein
MPVHLKNKLNEFSLILHVKEKKMYSSIVNFR